MRLSASTAQGKSTLIQPAYPAKSRSSAGEYTLGHNAEPDYFAQDQYKALDPEGPLLLDDLSSVASRASNTELRNILGFIPLLRR